MKWFGENWGAPVCAEEDQVPTPVNSECFGCDKPVVAGDQGVVLPFHGGEEDPRTEAPYHKNCFIHSILGGHLKESGERVQQFFEDASTKEEYKGQRPGQAAFNHLYKIRPDLAEQVRATDMDPYYERDLDGPNWTRFRTFVRENL